jgi:hypothetical protein
VAQKGLNRADVRAPLEKMGRKTVTECVRANSLVDPRLADCFCNSLVNWARIEVMPSHVGAPGISRKVQGIR